MGNMSKEKVLISKGLLSNLLERLIDNHLSTWNIFRLIRINNINIKENEVTIDLAEICIGGYNTKNEKTVSMPIDMIYQKSIMKIEIFLREKIVDAYKYSEFASNSNYSEYFRWGSNLYGVGCNHCEYLGVFIDFYNRVVPCFCTNIPIYENGDSNVWFENCDICGEIYLNDNKEHDCEIPHSLQSPSY